MPIEGVRQIVCPIDFSELSGLALRYADALAKCAGAQLTVVYANPFLPPPHLDNAEVAELREQFRRWHAEADQRVRRFAAGVLDANAARAEIRVVEALPVEAVSAAAQHADLVVLGTHGRGGVNRLMMGSVAERVLRESPIPVLTIRGGAASVIIQRVLCPVNNSGISRRALAWAGRIARCFGAAVTAMHVREADAPDAIADLRAWVPAGISALVRDGEPADAIVRAAAELKTDLVVIGARHRTFHDSRLIGDTTIRVVRHAPCPVLAVTPPALETSGARG